MVIKRNSELVVYQCLGKRFIFKITSRSYGIDTDNESFKDRPSIWGITVDSVLNEIFNSKPLKNPQQG